MPSDAVPAPSVQLLKAIRSVTEQPDLNITNIVVFYQDGDHMYGVLSSCCCGTDHAALMAAGTYLMVDVPLSGPVHIRHH